MKFDYQLKYSFPIIAPKVTEGLQGILALSTSWAIGLRKPVVDSKATQVTTSYYHFLHNLMFVACVVFLNHFWPRVSSHACATVC